MPGELWGVIIGLLFAGSGLCMFLYIHRKRKVCTEKTEGVVIGNEYRRATLSSKSANYFPIFSITVNNIEYKLYHRTGTIFKKFKEGKKVALYYNPANPEEFYMNEKFFYIITILWTMAGIGIMVLAFLDLIGVTNPGNI